jgi:hypothetical protein
MRWAVMRCLFEVLVDYFKRCSRTSIDLKYNLGNPMTTRLCMANLTQWQ